MLVGVWVLVPLLAMVPVLWLSTRWYLRRAKDGYLRENAAYAQMTSSLAETVEGARTVEALQRYDERVRRGDEDIRGSYRAERYTLRLRTVCFPVVEVGYLVPIVGTLLFGGWLHINGHVSLGAVTAGVLYVNQLIDPVDRLISWMDELQFGGAALARLLGITDVPDDRTPSGRDAGRRAGRGAGRAVLVRRRPRRAARRGPDRPAGRADRDGRTVRRGQVDARAG